MDYEYPEKEMMYALCEADEFMELLSKLDEDYPNHLVMMYETLNVDYSFKLMVKMLFISDTTKLTPFDTQEVQ